jgi:signal transduction histidine kinase
MRERAERIGGNFSVVSNANAGTAITLVVPEGTVYRGKHRNFVGRALRGISRVFGY